MANTADVAKRHYRDRFAHEKNMTMKAWCRLIHIGCDECRAWLDSKGIKPLSL